ncbi:hypothetical protein B23_2880 [Geobacillus thermoleovorans B23]|nr:hypothetical protein B23_2880 [Geobacillus thermoleovorans B23]
MQERSERKGAHFCFFVFRHGWYNREKNGKVDNT